MNRTHEQIEPFSDKQVSSVMQANDSDTTIATQEVKIENKLGLHARPAMQLVDLANKFTSTITIHKNDQSVNGKSIMDVLLLAATEGTVLTIQAQGPDASEATQALVDLIKTKFGEE